MWTVATATAKVARPTLVGENDQPIDPGPEEELDDFWHTSVGKFRFSLDELPQYLQLIHELLKVCPVLIILLPRTLDLQWYILVQFVYVILVPSFHVMYETSAWRWGTEDFFQSRIEKLIREGPAYKTSLMANSSCSVYHGKLVESVNSSDLHKSHWWWDSVKGFKLKCWPWAAEWMVIILGFPDVKMFGTCTLELFV